MKPIVTEEMARDFHATECRMSERSGTRAADDLCDALSEWLAKHFPAGEAVEQVDDEWFVYVMNKYHAMDDCPLDWVADMRKAFNEFGLKLVRVKPEAAKVETAEVDPRDAKIAELAKRVDALELGYRDAKATNAEIQDDVDRLDAATAELLEWCKRLSRDRASDSALEARKPETTEKSAGRVFSEAEVREAIKAGEWKSPGGIYAAEQLAHHLGIDLEATK